MDMNENKLIADGIKLLIKSQHDRILDLDSEEWLNKYKEVFPKEEPFGGKY